MQWSGKSTIDYSFARIKDLDQKRVQLDRVSGRVVPDIDKMAIGEAREYSLAVLHIDVNNYKKLTNNLSNPQILRFLNTFLSEMTYIVKDYSGIVEKYVGDRVSAVFGIGEDGNLAVKHAIECAITMLTVIKYAINPYFSSIALPIFTASIGLDYGGIWMARTGIPNFTQFTLVGVEVSIASQLAEHARKSQILVGEQFYDKLSTHDKGLCNRTGTSPEGWIWQWKGRPYWFFSYDGTWKDYSLRE